MAQNEIYNLLKKSINVTAEANKVVANNIANVNTKGYKRYYVPFEQVMKESSDGNDLKTTKNKHITNAKSDEIQVKRDNSSSMREDGNNVDIEVEMASQSANSLMYQSLIRFVSGKFSSTNSVIKGGK